MDLIKSLLKYNNWPETELITNGLNVNQVMVQVDAPVAPKISGDGRYVVFHSFASRILSGR